ncbi:MAG TPA: DUF3618 domain-containing protein [Longimicrobiaceae bacterium]
MADEHPLTRVAPTAVDGPLRPRREPEFPDDPRAARAEIEATRARMSDTLDEIEEVLLRKKESIRERMDVLAPVRADPIRTIAMIFGAAVLLGFLTAGRNGKRRAERDNRPSLSAGEPLEDLEDDEQDEEAELAWERAEEWEDRAHRLLRIARAQEAELEIHRNRGNALLEELRRLRRRVAREEEYDEDDEDEDELEPGFFERLRQSAVDRLADLVGEISHRMMRGG